MADKKENNAVNVPDVETESAETEKEEKTADDGGTSKKECKEKKLKSKIEVLEKEIKKLKCENGELNDKYLRVVAEYDNFRKRSQKEKEGIYAEALSDSVKEILPLLDNLERASSFAETDKLAEGFGLILKTIPEVLEKMGVECYGEKGESFDPNLHNAIMHEENDDYGENEIIDVFQKGYRTGDKIIRYAMVKVAN